jgi:hypothetical protein
VVKGQFGSAGASSDRIGPYISGGILSYESEANSYFVKKPPSMHSTSNNRTNRSISSNRSTSFAKGERSVGSIEGIADEVDSISVSSILRQKDYYPSSPFESTVKAHSNSSVSFKDEIDYLDTRVEGHSVLGNHTTKQEDLHAAHSWESSDEASIAMGSHVDRKIASRLSNNSMDAATHSSAIYLHEIEFVDDEEEELNKLRGDLTGYIDVQTATSYAFGNKSSSRRENGHSVSLPMSSDISSKPADRLEKESIMSVPGLIDLTNLDDDYDSLVEKSGTFSSHHRYPYVYSFTEEIGFSDHEDAAMVKIKSDHPQYTNSSDARADQEVNAILSNSNDEEMQSQDKLNCDAKLELYSGKVDAQKETLKLIEKAAIKTLSLHAVHTASTKDTDVTEHHDTDEHSVFTSIRSLEHCEPSSSNQEIKHHVGHCDDVTIIKIESSNSSKYENISNDVIPSCVPSPSGISSTNSSPIAPIERLHCDITEQQGVGEKTSSEVYNSTDLIPPTALSTSSSANAALLRDISVSDSELQDCYVSESFVGTRKNDQNVTFHAPREAKLDSISMTYSGIITVKVENGERVLIRDSLDSSLVTELKSSGKHASKDRFQLSETIVEESAVEGSTNEVVLSYHDVQEESTLVAVDQTSLKTSEDSAMIYSHSTSHCNQLIDSEASLCNELVSKQLVRPGEYEQCENLPEEVLCIKRHLDSSMHVSSPRTDHQSSIGIQTNAGSFDTMENTTTDMLKDTINQDVQISGDYPAEVKSFKRQQN